MANPSHERIVRRPGGGQDSESAEPAVSPEDVRRFLQSHSRYSASPKKIAEMSLIARDYGHLIPVSNHLVRSPCCPAESVVNLLEARVSDLNFVWYTMVRHSHQLTSRTVGWAYDNHGENNGAFAASLACYYHLGDYLRRRANEDHGHSLGFAWVLAITQPNLEPLIVDDIAENHGSHPGFATDLARHQTEMSRYAVEDLYRQNHHHFGLLDALARNQPEFPADLIRQTLDDYRLADDLTAATSLDDQKNQLRLSPEPPLNIEPGTNIFLDQDDPDEDALKFPKEIQARFKGEASRLAGFIHGLLENHPRLDDDLLADLWHHPVISWGHARHYIARRPGPMDPELVGHIYQQSQDSETALTDLFTHQPDQPAERLREAYNIHGQSHFCDQDFLRALRGQANLPADIRQQIDSRLGKNSDLGRAALEAAG